MTDDYIEKSVYEIFDNQTLMMEHTEYIPVETDRLIAGVEAMKQIYLLLKNDRDECGGYIRDQEENIKKFLGES